MKKLLMIVFIETTLMGQAIEAPILKTSTCKEIGTHIIEKIKNKRETIDSISSVLDKYEGTKLIADTIYKYCSIYDIDWKFLLAVGILETQLGTDPRAVRCRRNNTIFSVGEQNDTSGKSLYKYKTVHESIEGFCSLIQRRYKSNGRTEQDLLRNFTNVNGYRYATTPTYERTLRIIYNRL